MNVIAPTAVQVDAPVQGPISASAYFAPRPLVPGTPAVPRLAVGTAALGGGYGPIDVEESRDALLDAWQQGFLLTDTAPNYGKGVAEEIVGAALNHWVGPAPVLCTKLDGWGELFVPRAGETWRSALQRQFTRSAQRFGGRQITALAMHDADSCDPAFLPECLAYLEELHAAAQALVIGIGGGGPGVQLPCLQARPGAFGYLVTHLRLSAINLQALLDVVPEAKQQGVAVMAASPTFGGLLGDLYESRLQDPPPYLAPVFLRRTRALKALGEAAGLPLSHLALRFLLSMPAVDFVIAGPRHPASWADTLAAYHQGPLTPDVYAQVWRLAQEGPEPLIGG